MYGEEVGCLGPAEVDGGSEEAVSLQIPVSNIWYYTFLYISEVFAVPIAVSIL